MAFIYDLADTWNAAGTTFTAIKMNVTDSASAAGSLLMDLQVGGVSRFNVDKTGAVVISDGTSALTIDSTNGATTFLQTAAITLQTSNSMVLRHGNNDALFIRPATTGRGRLAFVDNTNGSPAYIYSDAANTLDQRNGVNAQAFRVYNTFTDASNFERLSIAWNTNVAVFELGNSGTGSARAQVRFLPGTATSMDLQVAASSDTNAAVNFRHSASASSAGSSVSYVGRISGHRGFFDGAGAATFVIPSGATDRWAFFGTTSSFPALKRNAATLQARLADDTAFTNIQGKLTTDTAYTAGSIVPTGYLTLYDSTGTAYRVPCVV